MFWNKKEDKGLPDLPPIKAPPKGFTNIRPIPNFPDSNQESYGNHEENHDLYKNDIDHEDDDAEEKHALPSFPDSPIEKGFSQAAIKDAVNNALTKSESSLSELSEEKPFKTIEMEEWAPSKSQPNIKVAERPFEEKLIANPQTQKYQPNMQKFQKAQQEKDVFVKIDKFYTAKKSLETIKDKVEGIDDLLKKIRETKLREEQELAGWEKDIATVKARIHEITENIFEKV